MVFDQIPPTQPNLGRFVARHAKPFFLDRTGPQPRF